MRPIRVYADTSVFGGVFDAEFDDDSREFFQQVRAGRFALVVSAIVQTELAAAPPHVREFFNSMLPFARIADVTDDALNLQRAYLQSNVVSPKYADDALHVALATVSDCALIVSWNFKHIVHFQKIPLYNAVNIIHGYSQLMIVSPMEVIPDEHENI